VELNEFLVISQMKLDRGTLNFSEWHDKYKTCGPRFWADFIGGLISRPICLFDNYFRSALHAFITGPFIVEEDYGQ
jgi:hypothetical protein